MGQGGSRGGPGGPRAGREIARDLLLFLRLFFFVTWVLVSSFFGASSRRRNDGNNRTCFWPVGMMWPLPNNEAKTKSGTRKAAATAEAKE